MVRAIPGRRTFGQRFLGFLGDALDSSSLISLAQQAGFSPSDAIVAAAIALAESGGNPQAVGDNGTSFGLWQIHTPAHPEFASSNLYDPLTNARAAYSVYQQQGWRAWSTYTSRAYLQYLTASPAQQQQQEPIIAPLTIDATTGQVIEDTTPTPGTDFSVLPSSGATGANYLLLTGAALAAYLLARDLFD